MANMSQARLNGRKTLHTAGCIIIGDEILNGKTTDTNSAYFAKWCFQSGIALQRIEVIPDDKADIISTVTRMSSSYDFVVTSGGIGPTHDDITYESISEAFNLPLKLHQPAFERMKRLSKPHPHQPNFDWDTPSPALTARLRMVELPHDKDLDDAEQVVFPADDLWVPVARINGNVHILPGVPRLFEKLIDGMTPTLKDRLVKDDQGLYRIKFSTPLPESEVAGYLTELAGRVGDKGIKVGSYPRWGKRSNTVTITGRDKDLMEGLVTEIEGNVKGRRVEVEGEDD